ncbi:MAG: tetratricopeptide repeat protein [Halieaceae bacterium]|jgi:tol-pal system protein YbgF|nr:tetratricopeptide repeat protein [Halieaceae bacterium]
MPSIVKPVLVAGFLFLATQTVVAQDYIDVEAERQAARRARAEQLAAEQAAQEAVTPAGPEALVPQTTTTPPAVTEGSDSGYGGIRPYSGTTRLATPLGETAAPAMAATAAPANMGDLVIKLQQLEADVRRLNGVVEEQAAQIQRLEQQSLERYVDLDRRLGGGAVVAPGIAGGGTATPMAPMAGGAAPATSASTGAGEAQPGEEAAYRAAYDLVRNRQFDRALTAFKAFLLEYPFGRFAPNAHYWIGELYLVIDPPDPELARQSFKLLLDQYPDNSKVPDALFKLGRVHFLKGNRDRSREYLDRVIARYGDEGHPAAQLAKDFIAENF